MYQSYERLPAWQKAQKLTLKIHKLIKTFPKNYLLTLGSELCEIVVQIPVNIVRGASIDCIPDKANYYFDAQEALYKLQDKLALAKELEQLSDNAYKGYLKDTKLVDKLISNLLRPSNLYPKALFKSIDKS